MALFRRGGKGQMHSAWINIKKPFKYLHTYYSYFRRYQKVEEEALHLIRLEALHEFLQIVHANEAKPAPLTWRLLMSKASSIKDPLLFRQFSFHMNQFSWNHLDLKTLTLGY